MTFTDGGKRQGGKYSERGHWIAQRDRHIRDRVVSRNECSFIVMSRKGMLAGYGVEFFFEVIVIVWSNDAKPGSDQTKYWLDHSQESDKEP
jgi:hypothetical protein